MRSGRVFSSPAVLRLSFDARPPLDRVLHDGNPGLDSWDLGPIMSVLSPPSPSSQRPSPLHVFLRRTSHDPHHLRFANSITAPPAHALSCLPTRCSPASANL